MNAGENDGGLYESTDLDRAEQDVTRAEAALLNRVEEATARGEATMERALAAARPIALGIVVLTGVVWLASIIRRSRTGGRRPAPSGERSVLAEATRAAALSLASVAARRVAERLLAAPARVALALLVAAGMSLVSATAAAQNKLSFDASAAFPSSSGSDDGFGLGLRFGHEWDLVLISIIPEIGVRYDDFSGPADATTFAGFGGGRVAIGFVLEPSVFLHAGIGHLGGRVSHTSLAYDLGAALDVTAIPVIDFGPHVILAGIAGDKNYEPFSWLEIGGHLTFNFGP